MLISHLNNGCAHEQRNAHEVNFSLQDLPPKLVKSAVRSERLKFQSCPKDPMESLDESSGPNCRVPISPTSDPNTEASMAIPGISDGVKGAWSLDAADEGLTAIPDDIALTVVVPALGASGAPLATTMLLSNIKSG
jgi:hypothetical protein